MFSIIRRLFRVEKKPPPPASWVLQSRPNQADRKLEPELTAPWAFTPTTPGQVLALDLRTHRDGGLA